MTLAITPLNAASTLVIEVVIHLSIDAVDHWVAEGLFKDSDVDAIASSAEFQSFSGAGVQLSFRHEIAAGSTSLQTFKVRAGGASDTTTFNPALFNGTLASSIHIEEIDNSGNGSGLVVQTQYLEDGVSDSGSTAFPIDDTTPQNDEGDEFLSLAITPKKSANLLVIEVVVHISNGAITTWLAAALFKDSDVNAISSSAEFQSAADGGVVLSWRHERTAGSTAAQTFAVRCGASTDTTVFNNALFNGTLASSIRITEIDPTGAGVLAPFNVVDDLSPQLGGDLDCNGSQIQWSKGADVIAGAALPVLTDGNYFDVTGTTTITSINTTGGIGTQIKLHFDAALLLTHGSTLVLPGAANYTTAAGDEFEFVEFAVGEYRCTGYVLASGEAIVGGAGGGSWTEHSVVTPGAVSTITFGSIPAGVVEITVGFNQVSGDSPTELIIQIGDSGGMESTNYDSALLCRMASGGNSLNATSSGFRLGDGTAGTAYSGFVTLKLIDESNNTWGISSVLKSSDGATLEMSTTSGRKSLDSDITQVRVFLDDADYDGGDISLSYRT
jgi:hypothetical protein